MLAILNILIAIFMTIMYSININVQFNFFGIATILGAFIVSFLIIVVVFLLIFIVFIYAFEKVNPKALWKHKVANLYSMYLFRFFNRVIVKVTGKENLPNDKNFVVYSNHIEYIDPLLVKQVYNDYALTFVAKEPLFKYIVLKNILYTLGAIPITKFADRSALKSILQAIKQVKEGQPMGIFPEGKRTYSNDLIEFKPGAFKLAQKAKADISPICLYNFHDLAKKPRILPTKVYIHILPIIRYDDYKEMDSQTLANYVFEIVNGQMLKFKEN